MPADSTTPLLGLLVMGTGNDNNAWGDNFNNSILTPVENAIAGVTSVAVTGGSVTLSAAQARSAMIAISGALTADQTIVVPATTKKWTFINNCSGAFFVLVKTAGGAPVNAPAGKFVDIFSDGTNNLFRQDRHEVGELFFSGGAVAPFGAIECNGGTALRASAVDLFAAIGTVWGAGDGFTTFGLPPTTDTGRYLRGRTGSVPSGTSQSNQNKSHTHTGSGNTGSMSANSNHSHTGSGSTSGASVDHTHTGSGTTATESVAHTHFGTTSGVSTFHTHTGSGTTSAMSANASHTHTENIPVFGGGATFPTSASGGGSSTFGSPKPSTDATNTDHTHTYSFTTSTDNVDHTHTMTTGTESALHTHTYSFTTGGASVDHNHSYSFTTSVTNVDHLHNYSFTTSTGSADGTEARPESIVAVLCIRY
jgi:hypothetical protein